MRNIEAEIIIDCINIIENEGDWFSYNFIKPISKKYPFIEGIQLKRIIDASMIRFIYLTHDLVIFPLP